MIDYRKAAAVPVWTLATGAVSVSFDNRGGSAGLAAASGLCPGRDGGRYLVPEVPAVSPCRSGRFPE